MVHEKGVVPEHIIHTPVWVTIIRGIQFFLAIVILGISAWLIHGAYIEELGFAIAVSLFTWIIVPYVLFTEKLPGLHSLYHIIAVLVLEGWMVIMWLACFASVAARRAKFVVPTTVDNCFSDGSLVGSHYCTEVRKREILKREVLLFKGGQAGMSAAAGLGALCWLLFVATFVYTMVMFFRARKEGRFVDVLNGGSGGHHDPETAAAAAAAGTGSYQMEPKPYDGAGAPTHNQGPYYAQVPHGGQEHHGQVPHGHQAPYNAQVPYSPQEVSPPQSFSPPPAGSYPPYQPSVSPQPTIPSQHGQELHAQPYGYQNQPAQQHQQQQQYYSSPPVHHHAPVTRNELPSNSHHVTSSAPRASSPVRSSSPGYSGGNSNNNSSSNDNNYSSY